jgi:hypothetical protein
MKEFRYLLKNFVRRSLTDNRRKFVLWSVWCFLGDDDKLPLQSSFPCRKLAESDRIKRVTLVKIDRMAFSDQTGYQAELESLAARSTRCRLPGHTLLLPTIG